MFHAVHHVIGDTKHFIYRAWDLCECHHTNTERRWPAVFLHFTCKLPVQFGNDACGSFQSNFRQKNYEFVSPQARNKICLSEVLLHRGCDSTEDFVPNRVSEHVISRLEVVQIDVCRGKWTAGSDGTMHFPFRQDAKEPGIHSARRVITARNILLSVQFLCLFYREHRDQKERQPDEAIPNQNPITRIFGAGQSVGYAPHHPPAVAIVTPSGKPANLLTRTIGIK